MCEKSCLSTKNITTLHTYETEYNADSVEWCPHEPLQHIFVCANYQLKKSEETGLNERIGNILLFSTTLDELKLVQVLKTPAILDQKWCHNQINGRSILGVVNADKSLILYSLNSELSELEMITSAQINSEHDEVLLLSLDWSTGKYSTAEPEILCSDSKGAVHRFRFINNKLIDLDTYHGHEYEAWITAFYYWDNNVFFSGGDDSCFLKYDQRSGSEPVGRNRSHNAGVTSMHSNIKKEFILATGSYDTFIRLWDIRKMKSAVAELETPGPLWRLKWDPFESEFLLAACMLGGVHIVNYDCEIIGSYYKHSNIAYGADWSFQYNSNDYERTIASCSFYDNLLCLWKIKI